jgi:hypothetical protein
MKLKELKHFIPMNGYIRRLLFIFVHFLAENEILISLPCRQAGNFKILNNIKLTPLNKIK